MDKRASQLSEIKGHKFKKGDAVLSQVYKHWGVGMIKYIADSTALGKPSEKYYLVVFPDADAPLNKDLILVHETALLDEKELLAIMEKYKDQIPSFKKYF
jgi:hypothetical protein